MTTLKLVIEKTFETVSCFQCGVEFAVDVYLNNNWRRDHTSWYCPNGHRQHYPAENEADKLRRELAAEQVRKQAALVRANQAETRAVLTERKLSRVAKGVCPCCSRSFKNLHRHMATKHKDFKP